MGPVPEDDVEQRQEKLHGHQVGIVSFRSGDKFVCRVDNVDPGTIIARGEGRTRAEAERSALSLLEQRLARSKQLQDTLTELHSRVASLDKRLSEPPPSKEE
jgi:hypothetical protein